MREGELRVLFWPIGDERTASTRHRLLNLLPFLNEKGLQATLLPGGKTTLRAALQALRLAPTVHCVFLQKKLLPPWYLRLLRRRSRKLVFDFDDALYAPRSRPEPHHIELANRLKLKLDHMLQAVDLVVAGNEALAAYARNCNPRVAVVPTTYQAGPITAKVHAAVEPVVLGWIGSAGTLVYLDALVPVLQALVGGVRSGIVFRVISNVGFTPPGLERHVQNVRWTLEDEGSQLQGLDIGVMPLYDDDWSRGKCGFKAIQMMTCGIPVVASPVGVNKDLINDGVDGYLAGDQPTWIRRLTDLAMSPSLRQAIGSQGRAKVLREYNPENWAQVLHSAMFDMCRSGIA
jgi:glycosyltransferase involved in cell wall biosynthesis